MGEFAELDGWRPTHKGEALLKGWRPTHRITVQHASFGDESWLLQFVPDDAQQPDGPGDAYSLTEARAFSEASWRRRRNGEWTWRSLPHPGGGIVSVNAL
jgi:hypothetical protein